MLEAPRKASLMEVHDTSPHRSIETSLGASAWPLREMPVRPETETV